MADNEIDKCNNKAGGCEVVAGAPARLLALAHFTLQCNACQHFAMLLFLPTLCSAMLANTLQTQNCSSSSFSLQDSELAAAASLLQPHNFPTLTIIFNNSSCKSARSSITIAWCHHKCLLQSLTQCALGAETAAALTLCFFSSSWFGKFYPNFTLI